ncbi:MAG: ABC transporter permease subunit [Candidatus Cloacimonetes bacterium]|nr:ABC transporter permease subunit [Candidatus Cloacimonadota bacterium]
MNWHKVSIVYKKELLDMVRDRRTVITSILLPIVLYPLLIVGFSSLTIRQEKKLSRAIAPVYVVNNSLRETGKTIRKDFYANQDFEVYPREEQTAEMEAEAAAMGAEPIDTVQMIKDGHIRALITLSDSTTASGIELLKVEVSYDRSSEKSEKAWDKVRGVLHTAEKVIIEKRLVEMEISPDITQGIAIISTNIATSQKMFGSLLGRLLPYFLLLLTVSSAGGIATDIIAGEKERGTLETLLVSGANRNELVVGKYLTVATITSFAVVLNIFSMYISFKHMMSNAGMNLTGMQMPAGAFLLVLISMIPLITMVSGLLLAVSAYARNTREAGMLFMPIMMVTIMMGMMSMMPGIELNYIAAVIPILNIALLFKQIMMDQLVWGHFATAMGSIVALDVLVVWVVVKFFNSESILFRIEAEKSVKFWGKNRTNILQPGFAIVFYFIAILLQYYVASKLTANNPQKGIMLSQVLLIFLPVWLLFRIGKINLKEFLPIRKTRPVNYLLTILMGIPVFLVVAKIGELINIFYPISENFIEAMSGLMNSFSPLMGLIVIAVMPAIFEELMFRGYFLNVFKKYGKWPAIFTAAFLFAAFHLNPFQFLPAFISGVWIGYLAVSSGSFVIAMLAHFVNNATIVLIMNYGDKIPLLKNLAEGGRIPLWLPLTGIVVWFGLLQIYQKVNPPEEPAQQSTL